MFVNARVVTQVRDNGLTVPLDAVQQGPQGQYVFVVGPDHKVAMQPVSMRETLGGEALIDKGLSAGETVVVRGQYRLTPGTMVSLANPAIRPRCRTLHGKLGSAAMNISATFIRRPIATGDADGGDRAARLDRLRAVAGRGLAEHRFADDPGHRAVARAPMRRRLPIPSRRRSSGSSAKSPV